MCADLSFEKVHGATSVYLTQGNLRIKNVVFIVVHYLVVISVRFFKLTTT